MIRRNAIPEGVRILPDGSWRIGAIPLSHPRRLRQLKQRLEFADGTAYLVDGERRLPVTLEGPPFQVDSIDFDAERGEVQVNLDDGTKELLRDPVIRMNPETGKFECAAKEGRTRAVFSRVAHDTLLQMLEE